MLNIRIVDLLYVQGSLPHCTEFTAAPCNSFYQHVKADREIL